MLVKCLSDLHLEFNSYRYVDHGEEVCILAGDISTGLDGVNWALRNIPEDITVLYVPGNHEYYGQEYATLNTLFKKHNAKGTHVHVLLNSSYTDNNWEIEFFGSTLWTDFKIYGDPEYYGYRWKVGLNDHRLIQYKDHSLAFLDMLELHRGSIQYLSSVSSKKRKVLITHYCPDRSVADHYKNDPLTPGFASHIPISIHEQFEYHFHGHTHEPMNYEYPYGTKILCNPKGYGWENPSFNPELVLDI